MTPSTSSTKKKPNSIAPSDGSTTSAQSQRPAPTVGRFFILLGIAWIESIKGYQKSIEIPNDAGRGDRDQTIMSQFGIARAARLIGKDDQAEFLFQQVLTACQSSSEPPENVGHILSEYARLQWAKGNYPKADQFFTQAYQWTVAKRGEMHRDVADILASHSLLLQQRQKKDLAKQMDSRAKKIYQMVH
jgi:tetratricopeptide (TPR) repeat protein